jgi:hypothetical protein
MEEGLTLLCERGPMRSGAAIFTPVDDDPLRVRTPDQLSEVWAFLLLGSEMKGSMFSSDMPTA